ncbi:MAG: sigma-54 dependent transcriptional regulator [Thiolinea sp.]
MISSNSTSLPGILVVDDEPRALETLRRILDEEFEVHTALNAAEARKVMEQEWIKVVLCDQRMPEMTGIELCAEIRERWPETIRMIISGYTDPDDLIAAINDGGIYQFISKPWRPDEVISKLKNAVELFELHRKTERLSLELKLRPKTLHEAVAGQRRILQSRYSFDDGIVRSPDSCMQPVCETIRQLAPYDVSVLITGESGTGKELCARALHYNSLRQNEPFVAENCGALPDELLESELFGHKRGAFTGATQDRAGLFQSADGGTLFLDEIGDTSAAFQLKLLRVLQEGEVRPLGSNTRIPVNVRVISATNRNLEEAVREGRFRQDLYYRLSGFEISVPPLRERLEDVPYLAVHLLEQFMQELGKKVSGFSREAINCLQAYHWPGNVRELQNEIKRMLVLAQQDTLGAELMSAKVLRATPEEQHQDMRIITAPAQGTLKDRVESLESRIVHATLVRNRWNKSRTADELGLSRVGLRSKMERYGLEQPEDTGSTIADISMAALAPANGGG